MAGIYVHIPFCKHACTYCDFHFSTTFEDYREKMIQSIGVELITRKNEILEEIETIYFGGGTPSLLTKTELSFLLQTIFENYEVSEYPEITLETNPDNMTVETLHSFFSLGINRLSIGIQSFDDEILKWMERSHDANEAKTCVQNAQKVGFKNISIDLIYGLPNQTLNQWKDQLKLGLSMNVQHISSYCLTVEKGTKLGFQVAKKRVEPLDETIQTAQFEELIHQLEKAGFEQYEISNFSLPNLRSKHNTSYWEGKPYLGIGPSAHSFIGNTRSWNISNNTKYIQLIDSEKSATDGTENLTLNEQGNEFIMTRLRLSDGLDLNKLNKIQEITLEQATKISEFREKNWILEENSTIKLTKSGKIMADFIASELFF